MDEWLDPAEAARLLQLPERFVYTLIEEHQLPALRWPVRIRRSDLDRCLEACRIRPGDLSRPNAPAAGATPTRPDRRIRPYSWPMHNELRR